MVTHETLYILPIIYINLIENICNLDEIYIYFTYYLYKFDRKVHIISETFQAR